MKMARRKKGNPVHGWINFNKPVGMSSNQAVGFIRRIFNAQKAGHGGTLDPLAEGVLPIALGEGTKMLAYMLDHDKYYRFTMKFGTETSTDDAEGDVVHTSDKRPTEAELKDVVETFIGEIEQTPPVYSAIKIDGKRACDRARDGEEVELKPRQVTVHKIDVEAFSEEEATLHVHVSKGTYVRSLAHDMGRKLGCYAYVTRLIRTKVDKFSLNDGISKEMLDSCAEMGQDARAHLLDVDVVLDSIPVYTATEGQAQTLLSGQSVKDVDAPEGQVRVKNSEGQLVSLAVVNNEGLLTTVRNFPALVNDTREIKE
jgi:tRNA pseudouridine55 synthase